MQVGISSHVARSSPGTTVLARTIPHAWSVGRNFQSSGFSSPGCCRGPRSELEPTLCHLEEGDPSIPQPPCAQTQSQQDLHWLPWALLTLLGEKFQHCIKYKQLGRIFHRELICLFWALNC